MAEDRPDDLSDEAAPGEERGRTGIRRRLGRLLNQKDLAEDTREVFTGVLEMSDRAKTEAVRLVAREARHYLDELKIKEDLLDLMTSHSLEVSLSVHLKPLADAARSDSPAPQAAPKGGGKPRDKAKPRVEASGEPPTPAVAESDVSAPQPDEAEEVEETKSEER